MATLFELAAHIQSVSGAETLLMMIVKATLILLIARLMLAAMPRASAASRHAIATAALVGVAAMPVLTFFAPAWNVVIEQTKKEAPAPAAAPAPQAQTANRQIGVIGEDEASATPANTPSTLGTAITLARATGVVPDEPLSAMERAVNIGKSTWKGWFVIAVQFVAMLMLAQMVLGIFGVWFVAKKAEEVTHDDALRALDDARDQLALGREVRLLRSSRISVPVLWGFFRPILLLPADVVTWPAERLNVVLLHELAHLKRFDGISLILTRIAACLFWYHPLAWSLERTGRNECERACDDLVLASGTKPSVYADHLLAIARSMPTFDPFRSVTLAMSRKTQLEGRLLSILQPHVVRRALSGRGIIVACVIALGLIAPLSAIRLVAAPPEGTQQQLAKDEVKTDSSVSVTPDIEAIEDYLVARLGKYDKRIDKLARDPKTGHDWYDRAYTYYRADRFAEAADAFKRAAEKGYREETALYNAACSHALLGEVEPAIVALQQALDAGWDDFDKIAEDSDFDPIRSDARFARAIRDSSGEIVSRRINETMRRYEELKTTGKIDKRVGEAIHGGIIGGVADAVSEAVSTAVSEAVTQAVVSGKHDSNYDYDFDFDFDFDHDDTDWFDVGLDLLRLRQLDQAINAFEHSIKEGDKTSTSMYNLACAYSLKGDVSQGMQWLEKAINEGFSNAEKLRNDPDIALLRQQRDFDRLERLSKELEMRTWKDDDDDEGWGDSVEYHKKVVAKHPNSGRAWFNLGFTALQAREFDTGIDAFHRAISLGHRVGTSSYNIACGYSLKGDNNQAFEWLKKAREAGFDLRSYLRQDDDLDNLHDDPRWSALVTELGARSKNKHKAEKTK